MTIEAVAVPTRSRLFTEQDAAQAYGLLTGYTMGEDGKPVLDEDGNPTPQTDAEGNPVKPQAVKFGEYPLEVGKDDPNYKAERDKVESKARTQGMSLDRLINSLYGRRFGTSVWINPAGNVVGALQPREPVQRKAKEDNGQPAPTRSRSRSK